MEQPISRPKALRVIAIIHGALAVIIPMLISLGTGTLLWAITLNKRKALNGMTLLLGWLGSLAAGMRLNISGLHFIEENRPAVFIFNHQSGIDPIILCRILRKNIIGVAKVELRTHPVIGLLLKFGDTLFIDRGTKQSKQVLLDEGINALTDTLSVAIAPEGTRSRKNELGQFKAGAFHLAKAANRPIVPIVIMDSKEVLPARSLCITPGTVSVKVLPPIYPNEWEDLTPSQMALKMQHIYTHTLNDTKQTDKTRPDSEKDTQ